MNLNFNFLKMFWFIRKFHDNFLLLAERTMEGEKETAEEKEEEEEEPNHIAAATSLDYPDLPIMHWEDLSQRIAELEKQEQESSERAKVSP